MGVGLGEPEPVGGLDGFGHARSLSPCDPPGRSSDMASGANPGASSGVQAVMDATRNVLLAALALLLAGPSCGSGKPSLATPRATPTWTAYESEDGDFAVSYPSEWFKADGSLTPHLENPTEILSVGTFSLEPGPSECAQFAGHAMSAMNREDALVSFQESSDRLEGRYVVDRPDTSFSLESGYATDGRECVDDPVPFEDRFIPFTYGERSFYAYAAWGEQASAGTKQDILSILDSFRTTE